MYRVSLSYGVAAAGHLLTPRKKRYCLTKLAQVTFLTGIWEMPGSNFGQKTDYPDLRKQWFSIVPPVKCPDYTLNYATTTSFSILSNSLLTAIRSYNAI
jgi:hypothetical protein